MVAGTARALRWASEIVRATVYVTAALDACRDINVGIPFFGEISTADGAP